MNFLPLMKDQRYSVRKFKDQAVEKDIQRTMFSPIHGISSDLIWTTRFFITPLTG